MGACCGDEKLVEKEESESGGEQKVVKEAEVKVVVGSDKGSDKGGSDKGGSDKGGSDKGHDEMA